MLKGAIFDHDGTMFDTEVIWQANWQRVAKDRGIKLPDTFKYEICGTSGKMMEEIVSKYYKTDNPQVIIKDVTNGVYQDELTKLQEKEGLRELLEYFKEKGVKMIVASSSPKDMIEHNLINDHIDNYFEDIVSGRELKRGKPFPDIFIEAAKRLNLSNEECYVFEDAYNGVLAGKASGSYTIMIPDLIQPNDEIKEKADKIYPSFKEVLIDLKKENI